MIKYNSNTINDWNFGDDNIIKVYRDGVVVYYKVITSGSTPEYKVCYAVVDDISQYSETEYEDVFDKATEKWYKLNNINEYEQYGVYASGRTSCSGGASRLPQGYTEVEYIQNTGTSYINTNYYPNQDTRILAEMQVVTFNSYGRLLGAGNHNTANTISCDYVDSGNIFEISWGGYTGWTQYSVVSNYDKHTYDWNKNYFYIDGTLLDSKTYNTFTCSYKLGIFNVLESGNVPTSNAGRYFYGKLYSFKIYDNGTLVRDFVPAMRDSDNKYGLYDIVNDVFYLSPNGNNFIGGEPVTPTDCVTTYEGKLTVDDGYEYIYSGNSWVNVGEVSGSSRLPAGYTEVEYIRNSNYNAYINTGVIPFDNVSNTYTITTRLTSEFHSNLGCATIINCEELQHPWTGFGYRYKCSSTVDEIEFNGTTSNYTHSVVDNGDETRTVTIQYSSNVGRTTDVPVQFFACWDGNYTTAYRYADATIYSSTIVKNGVTVRDFVPAMRNSDSKYGLYDLITDTFYTSPNGNDFSGGSPVAPPMVLPIYYEDKSDPLDNLSFSSMTEAQTYACNNCVYDGLKSTIDGDRYYFDSSDENGWVKILSYYKFEDVTPNAASGWTIVDSDTYNPDRTYYDDFSVENSTTSYVTKLAKITIYGYESFTYYLRSSGYSSYSYATATNIDEIASDPTSNISYSSSSAITNTYTWHKAPKSDVNLSNYRRVTYNNLDKNVEHTFYVCFYGRTYSSYLGNATILIPKEQTNENWEQVTFSTSTNVSGSGKSLYIDGNNSTSGGTQYFYNRWMIGLPSGSHSSNVSYSNYNYCPDVTSSTFTSVAGNSRLVEYSYNGTTNKTLQFRLVDESGNTINTADTVYYSMTYYNSCGASSSSSNLTFPRVNTVKVGGKFYFTSSSNRHYIYGYQPNIQLSTYYYSDNYNTYFDIPYTKLSTEAVTVTYVTYDPNDVEVPAFSTKISYPYGNSGTTTNTLTSYDVPYTYTYDVAQTNNKFSADSQSFTAEQAARTITFTLYPNNRDFSTVADLEAYQYAWEGMRATVGDTKYKYTNGGWVEQTHSLPDVPFTVNYNAKQYNASTKTLLKTEGQLANVDAVITAGTPTVNDGYLTIAAGTRATISGYQNYFNRDNSNPNLTIISKQNTRGSYCHMFANRDINYNWMYRCYSYKLALHGASEVGSVAVTTQPVVESVRVNSSRLVTYNNYTDNTTTSNSKFSYGSTNSTATALFAGYAITSGEWFDGDFYWVYMCQGTLTDEQVLQVIDYNENM